MIRHEFGHSLSYKCMPGNVFKNNGKCDLLFISKLPYTFVIQTIVASAQCKGRCGANKGFLSTVNYFL